MRSLSNSEQRCHTHQLSGIRRTNNKEVFHARVRELGQRGRLVHLDERLQHGARIGVAGGDFGGGDLVLDGGAGAAHAVGRGLGHQLRRGRKIRNTKAMAL